MQAIAKAKDLAVSIEGMSLEEKKSLLAKCATTTLSPKLIGGEKEFFAAMVVDAVLVAIGNDDRLKYFADQDVFCAGRVTEENLNRVSAATGGTVQTNVLGSCELFEEMQVGNERFCVLSGCPLSRTVTIVILGGAEQFIEESERSLHDANMMFRRALKNSTAVAGGGAVNMVISRHLRQNARTLGRSQLFSSYAKALEVPGGNMRDSILVNAYKKTFSTFSYAGSEQQPNKFLNPKILLLNIELEMKSEKENAEIRLSDPSRYQSIVDAERNIIYEKLDKCVSSGAKIILSRLAIGDLATQYFEDIDVYCAGRFTEENLNRVAAATGGTVQTTVKNVTDEVLGSCEMFEERQIGKRRFYIFSGCPLSQRASVFIRCRAGQKNSRLFYDRMAALYDVKDSYLSFMQKRKGSSKPVKKIPLLNALIRNGKIFEMMKYYDLKVVPCESVPENMAFLEVNRNWEPSAEKVKLVAERTEQLCRKTLRNKGMKLVLSAFVGFGIVDHCFKLYSATKGAF